MHVANICVLLVGKNRLVLVLRCAAQGSGAAAMPAWHGEG